MIKVSVIVPTYNREKYIKKCLDSLISQTLDDIEIIIIDDGSTDNTKKVIEKYNNSKINYYHKSNTGIGDSRNLGIKKARGEYLCFVDSDDFIDKNMLERCYDKAINDNLDIVICDYIEINEITKNTVKFHIPSFNNTTLYDNPSLILDVNLGPCNRIIKKELLEKNLFPTDIKYEDMALMVDIMKKAGKIGKIDEYLCYFTIHKNSETSTIDYKIFDIFTSLDMIKETLKDPVYKDVLNKLIVRKLTIYTIQQRCQKNKQIRISFIDKAFEYLNKNVLNYKKYFKDRGLRGIIEKNKILTKLYVNIYSALK